MYIESINQVVPLQNIHMIKRSYFLPLMFIFLSIVTVQSQDITVQTFNYNSETRDTVIQFPDVDHNNWEKIIMQYSMRCKDGLVSPPVQGQTNIGCGEWDYSCNTYIEDSTQVDSLYRVSPDFVISNFDESEFNYSESPTYTYYQSTFKDVNINGVTNEIIHDVLSSDTSSDIYLGATGERKRFQFEWSREDLLASGLTAGSVKGLLLNAISGTGTFKNFKVRLRNGQDGTKVCFSHNDFKEVFYNNITFDASNNKLVFYDDFLWNGSDPIHADFSFEIESSDLMIDAAMTADAKLINASTNSALQVNGQGAIRIAEDFSSISTQITISAWTRGSDALPIATTFLEGIDTDGNRQLNVHLPWSNSQIYWDCGGVGATYDRINKTANAEDFKNKWNHWTFTKDATTGEMFIYLNGNLWHGGSGKVNTINLDTLVIGASSGTRSYFGDIDDVKIWNRALTGVEIRDNYCGNIDPSDASLVLHYDFNNIQGGVVSDKSPNGYDAEIIGDVWQFDEFPRDIKLYESRENYIPGIEILTGDYDIEINDHIALDSVINIPHQVDEYVLDGTDRILGSSSTYFLGGDMPIYDEQGNLTGTITTDIDGTIVIGELEHYTKTPMRMEIMSFVTPYGINLDLGWEGKTWTFDVTDFGPILKGDKRIYLTRGGQWQEDMDIKFLFYEGTPVREVHSIQQIWPVTSESYTVIQNDQKFEPRLLAKESDIESVVVKTTITGHGQEGEFIPRNHHIKLNGTPLEWTVWTECADNPIYPQGGTWVYDRAGWCPGAASDTKVFDISGIFGSEPIEIDYGVNIASGDSRYIVNSQVVKYGAPNFANDATLEDIINPTSKIEHGRYNSNCGKPTVIIKNTGSQVLESATIVYGVVGGVSQTYEWTGNLNFLATQEIELDYLPILGMGTEEEIFFARIESPNGVTDEYPDNSEMQSDYVPVDELSTDVVINFRTNNNVNETSYRVYDVHGTEILNRIASGLQANTTYYDTLRNLNGCYRIEVIDTGENGLDWWANAAGGVGYIRVKSLDGSFFTIADDFGSIVEYNFVAGTVSNTHNVENDVNIELFPNPAGNYVQLIAEGLNHPTLIQMVEQSGKQVKNIPLNGIDKNIHQSIYIDDLVSGMYYVRIYDSNGVITRKLVKM